MHKKRPADLRALLGTRWPFSWPQIFIAATESPLSVFQPRRPGAVALSHTVGKPIHADHACTTAAVPSVSFGRGSPKTAFCPFLLPTVATHEHIGHDAERGKTAKRRFKGGSPEYGSRAIRCHFDLIIGGHGHFPLARLRRWHRRGCRGNAGKSATGPGPFHPMLQPTTLRMPRPAWRLPPTTPYTFRPAGRRPPLPRPSARLPPRSPLPGR